MDSRRDRLNVLGYTYTLVIVYAIITGVNTTACTDRTGLDNFNYDIQMCSYRTLKNIRVVIDTWGTGGGDIYNCTCTVTLDTGSASPKTTTTVLVEEYPRIAPQQNCGSILVINSTKSSSFTKTGCTAIPATPTNNFGTSDMLTLTLYREDVSTSWISGHCILISPQGSTNLDLIVTCNEPQGRTNQSITPITPTTTEEYVPTTTTQSRETTASSSATTTTTQSREITTYDSTYTGQTEPEQEKCVQISHPQQGYPISAVVVPLLVTLLIIVVSTTANVVIYRRRLALLKQPKYTEAVMPSPNPVHYDSLDLSRVEPPNLYADTSTGQMYVNTAME